MELCVRALALLALLAVAASAPLSATQGGGLPGPPPACTDTHLQRVAWGVGSSATQVEGAPTAGGRAPSVWDVFAAQGGKIQDGSTPARATDFFNRYKEDIALMKQLGVKNFRMSFSWSRLLPQARNGSALSPAGVAFYSAVLDELKAAGIEPAVTLFHWDTPQSLQDRYQGFLDRQIVDDFAYYADVVFKTFGDRVKKWITFNEPWVTCNLQYGNGDFAPGVVYGDAGKWKCGHNLLLAHATAVKLYRQKYQPKQGGKIGMALWSEWSEPWTNKPEDKRAAQNKLDTDFGWFADAIHFGDYPEQLRRAPKVAALLPQFTDAEKALLKRSYDYMGLTIYTAKYASDQPGNPNGWWVRTTDPSGKVVGEQAESYWLYNVPWSISRMLRYMKDRYDSPYIWVLENGISEKKEDTRTGAAATADPLRTDYFRGYISEACRAMDDGVKLTHFFAWSFTDNWEWKEGFVTRFGLVRVDFDQPGLPRRVKDSGRWLSTYVLKASKKQ